MRSASNAVVKHNPKSAKVNMMNVAQAEDSSDVIMGNLPVNDIPAKPYLIPVHRIVSCQRRSLPSMISLWNIWIEL